MSEYEKPGPWLYLNIDCSIPAILVRGIPIKRTIITKSPKYGFGIKVCTKKDSSAQMT